MKFDDIAHGKLLTQFDPSRGKYVNIPNSTLVENAIFSGYLFGIPLG
jgi:hypothetical protein